MNENENQRTDKAGIIATFYGPRDKIQHLNSELRETLGFAIQASPNVPRSLDPNQGIFLFHFEPPAAHDTGVVWLALSEAGEAYQAWEKLDKKLKNQVKLYEILDRFADKKALWGYNLIYHAAFIEGETPNKQTRNKLLTYVQNLEPSEKAEWLAYTKVEGTDLWLMDVPVQNGSRAVTVYVALAPLDKENDMITKVLYGPGAILLMPDLIAHKGYYHIRQLTEQIGKRYEEQLEGLRNNIALLLGLSLPNRSGDPRPHLEKLSKPYARLLMATSGFDDLRIGLAQQLENYTLWEDELGEGNLAQYQRQQMRITYRELELLIDKGQRILDATRTTIEMEQTKLDKKREQRENKISALIGILGVALAVSQIIDPTAAQAILNTRLVQLLLNLLNELPWVWLSSNSRLLQLAIQFLITILLTGVIYWLYQKLRFKRPT